MKFQDETKFIQEISSMLLFHSSSVVHSNFFFFPPITRVNQVPWMNIEKNIIHEFSMDAVSLMNMDKISSMKKLNFHGTRGSLLFYL